MKWKGFAAVIGLLVAPAAVLAQRLPIAESSDFPSSTPYHASFFDASGVVRFELIQGRLCLDPPRHRKGSQSHQHDGVSESITVTAERGIPSLHYVFQSPQQALTLGVHQSRDVRAESWRSADDSRCLLVQPPHGDVQFRVSRGALDDLHVGATLIHVRQGDPISFDQHFGELVACLLRGQSLADISRQAEREALASFQAFRDPAQPSLDQPGDFALHRTAGHVGEGPSRHAVIEQVQRLRSPRRSQRVAAERSLLSWGTPILPTLRSLARSDWDAEQRARIDAIMEQLRPRVGDTPASLARLLTHDRDYWSAVSPRLTGAQIQLANRYFQQQGLEPIAGGRGPAARIATVPD